MENPKFEILRNLAAKYWRPFISLFTITGIALNVLKIFDIPVPKDIFAVGKNTTQIIILITIFALIYAIFRFPAIAVLITKIIIGKSKKPSGLPSIFRGPRSYDENDTDIFPGRKKEINDLWIKLREKSFFILEGESGCGKTSLIKAGLLPKLKDIYTTIQCRIDNNPFEKIATCLHGTTIRRDKFKDADEVTLQNAIEKYYIDQEKLYKEKNIPVKPLFLIIDQFEELFVTVPDTERERFMKSIYKLVKQYTISLLIIIRDDFRDLLDKICRKIDEEAHIFDLSNYFILHAFDRQTAENILNELLQPIYNNDPIIKTETQNYIKNIVSDMLRPPSDKRCNIHDQKTVLPAELQTINMLIENTGTDKFTVNNYNSLGGKLGLYKSYIEDVRDHVMRKTGLSEKKTFLILKTLISPAQTKTKKSVPDISTILDIPPKTVKNALDGFCEKYIILKTVAEPGDKKYNENVYELMHEHMVHILNEAPEPVLQKANNASERLLFWEKQIKPVQNPKNKNKLKNFLSLFSMPTPLLEAIKLWKFADKNDKGMLRKTLSGFTFRFIAVLFFPFIFYLIIIQTDYFQIYRIRNDTPILKLIAGHQYNVLKTNRWFILNILDNKYEYVNNIIKNLNDSEKSCILSDIAVALIENNQSKRAKNALEDAINYVTSDDVFQDRDKYLALLHILGSLTKTDKLNLTESQWDRMIKCAQSIENNPEDEVNKNILLFKIAATIAHTHKSNIDETTFAKIFRCIDNINEKDLADLLKLTSILTRATKIDLNESTWNKIIYYINTLTDFYKIQAMLNISMSLTKTGRFEIADKTWKKTISYAEKINSKYLKTQAYVDIAIALTKYGKHNHANKIWGEIIQTINSITSKRDKYNAFENIIIQIFINPTMFTEIIWKQLFNTAINFHEIDDDDKVTLVYCFTKNLPDANYNNITKSTWDKVINYTKTFHFKFYKVKALSQISLALAKAGRLDHADETWHKAITLADKMNNDFEGQTGAYINIAKSLTKAGRNKLANKIWYNAVKSAKRIEPNSPYYRSLKLLDLAVALEKTKKPELADQVWVQILKSTKKIEGEFYYKLRAFKEIALKLVETEKYDEFITVQSYIETLCNKPEIRDSESSSLYLFLSECHTSLKNYKQARLCALKCKSDHDKEKAFSTILESYLTSKEPEMKKILQHL